MLKAQDDYLEYVELLARAFSTKTDIIGDRIAVIDFEMTINNFVRRVNSGAIKPPFKYRSYFRNGCIVAAVRGYDMDVRKFWFAMLFVFDYVENRCFNRRGEITIPPVKEQLKSLLDFFKNHPDAQITVTHPSVKKKNQLVITKDANFGQALANAIDCYCTETQRYLDECEKKFGNAKKISKKHEDEYNKFLYSHPIFHYSRIDYSDPSPGESCLMMALATKMFRQLFVDLDLEDKSTTYTKENVSFDRMLLISRVAYLFGYTKTESYLSTSNPLTKNYAKYKDEEIPTTLATIY